MRNRYWWYRSLYDDYLTREMRYSLFTAALISMPYYWWGVRVNRETEVAFAHINYENTYGPRRNRLTHSMLFEQFEIIKE